MGVKFCVGTMCLACFVIVPPNTRGVYGVSHSKYRSTQSKTGAHGWDEVHSFFFCLCLVESVVVHLILCCRW